MTTSHLFCSFKTFSQSYSNGYGDQETNIPIMEVFAYEHDISRSQFGRYENREDLGFSSLLKVVKLVDMTLKEFFSEGFD